MAHAGRPNNGAVFEVTKEKEEVFKLFWNSGFHGKPWPNKTMAIVITDGAYKWFENEDGGLKRHAEYFIIEYLKTLVDEKDRKNINVEIYINYSPCENCSKALVEFLNNLYKQSHYFFIAYYFVSLYRINENRNEAAFATLLKECGTNMNIAKKNFQLNIYTFSYQVWEKFATVCSALGTVTTMRCANFDYWEEVESEIYKEPNRSRKDEDDRMKIDFDNICLNEITPGMKTLSTTK